LLLLRLLLALHLFFLCFSSAPSILAGPGRPAALAGACRRRRANLSRFLAREHPKAPGSCRDLPRAACEEAAGVGGCRCHRHVTNRTTLQWSNRARLCELSRSHPALIDAKLSYIPRPAYASIADACERRGLTSGYSHLADHSRFRYLISTDGSTIDDTRVYWMLSTGSLVFKQITPLLPYGVPGLEPWVHFVPVREDLGDLVAKVRWARQNDPACRGMAEG
ncbi:unnamed protein product, partial [Prorocentrum cordatum]